MPDFPKFSKCETCGKLFTPKRPARFCSAACRQRAYRLRLDPDVGSVSRLRETRRRAAHTRQTQTVLMTCEQCGKEFYRTGAEANRLYCSDACKQRAYRQRLKTPAPLPHITRDEFIARNGLLEPETYHIDEVITLDVQQYPRCYPGELLTDDQRAELRKLATVTKMGACDLFAIKPGQFDKAKREHPINHVQTRWARGGQGVLYIYRLADVMTMLANAGLLEGAQIALPTDI